MVSSYILWSSTPSGEILILAAGITQLRSRILRRRQGEAMPGGDYQVNSLFGAFCLELISYGKRADDKFRFSLE
jgi:hypothetical protein